MYLPQLLRPRWCTPSSLSYTTKVSSPFRKHGLHLKTAAADRAERGASGAIVQGSSQPSPTGFLSITIEGQVCR